MRLLVIEDEVKLAEYLRKGLTEEGYVVDVAHNGVDGLHLAMEADYDLLVLDGMLPGIDGLGLLAALRQSKQTPVLMLTARIRVEDRVKGLQGGADDYLVKPFAFSELVARIQVLLRRARPAREPDGATVLGLSDLEMDLLRRKATRAGRRLDLTGHGGDGLAQLRQPGGHQPAAGIPKTRAPTLRADGRGHRIDWRSFWKGHRARAALPRRRGRQHRAPAPDFLALHRFFPPIS